MNGLAFEVYRQLGYGYHEKYYHRAYAKELEHNNLPYINEHSVRITYKNGIIGRYQIDFVIDKKVVVEWKVGREFYTKHARQVLAYLKTTGLHLGLFFLCTPDGIKVKRFAN